MGCLLSILFWKFNRQALFQKVDLRLRRSIKNPQLLQGLYIIFIISICLLLEIILKGQVYNGITAFLVLDISNSERENLSLKERADFYNTISRITRAIVCGFTAPLFYIAVLGNYAAIIYMIVYNLSYNKDNKIFMEIWRALTIIPALLVQIFLYIVYLIRHKELKVDFKGDYLSSVFKEPLLNVNILAAYIESVNFYYYFEADGQADYIKSYGRYKKSIEYIDIKDYLGIAYLVCMINFMGFVYLLFLRLY